MGRTTIALLGIAISSAAAGCGDDPPAEVAGNYSIAVTNGDNGCNFTDWDEGETAQNIPFEVTQDNADITGTVGGTAAAFLGLWLGGNDFFGTISGHHLDLTLAGAQRQTDGCVYNVNANIDAVLDGDALEGTITYTTTTNRNADCEPINLENGCQTLQDFNGTRPPT